MKSCTKCGQEKPLTEFRKDSRLKSKRASICTSCNKASMAKSGRDPDYTQHKQCSVCGKTKSTLEFHRQRNGKYGVRSQCKPCTLSAAKLREKWHKENNTEQYQKRLKQARKSSARRRKERPLYMLEYRYQTKYNISIEELNTMREVQDFKCKVCGIHESEVGGKGKLCVDHCHKGGHVRGLLCTQCNTGLGYFKDNVKYLLNAIKYLEQ